MKIEKGKLYKDAVTGKLSVHFQDSDTWSDKIAVHCPTVDDVKFISEKVNFKFDDYDSITREVFYLDEEVTSSYDDYKYYYKQEYKLITIDQFKEFYPPEVEQDPYVWGDKIVISNKKDVIVQNVVQKYQQRSDVGIQKYGTTLQENNDGIEIFLTHLQEELMDATLYIEKLKNKFAQLKKEL